MTPSTQQRHGLFWRWTLAACFVLAGLALGGCGEPGVAAASGEATTWRFAIEETQGSVQHAYALKFKELIEQKSDGEINVIVYTYGKLGSSDDVTEQLRMGTVHFAMASPGHVSKLIPELGVLLLHFVLSDDMRVNQRALNDPQLVKLLNDLYAEKGLKLLDIFQEGWMVWTTQKPITKPADWRNVKIRTMTSPALLAAYNAYGASPTPLAYSEVYSALQLNMIDAQVNPIFAIQEMSFYEVSRYMIFANHSPFTATAVTNQQFYRNLPDARRKMVDETVNELQDFVYETQQQFNEERMQIIRKNAPDLNIVRLSEEQRARFREAAKTAWDAYLDIAGDRGQEVLNRLREAVKKAESEMKGEEQVG